MSVAVMMHVVQEPSVKTYRVHTSANVLKALFQILTHKQNVLEWLPVLQTKIAQEMQSVMIINAVSALNPMLEMNVDVSEQKLPSYILYPYRASYENFKILFIFQNESER
jgi:hypothetical protein